MSFDWREFLALAKALQQSPHTAYSTETAQRCAVSRAYYSAFCYVRNYAKAHLGFQPQVSADDHKNLRELLRKHNPGMATQLDSLRQWRNTCDYDDVVRGNLTSLVPQAIIIAETLINAFP